jgi:unsaturated chondroitin disaccharide hydrolase
VCYRESNDAAFLETARRTADYFLDHLPADFVPQADFDSPFTDLEHKDSSAAAVAASALIELSNLEPDPVRRDRYWNAAVHILSSLTAPPYLSSDSSNASILLHGSRRFPGDNTSYIFGDYYLIEAATRYAASAANHADATAGDV